jgi:outer membrane protein assembly factor BamB
MLAKTIVVLALAASWVMTGAPPGAAGTRHLAASQNSPWSDTDYNTALSRANLTETALNPSTVKNVTYRRSITSPVIPPGANCTGDIVAPVLVGGDLFAVTNGRLSAYDAATGNLIWRRTPDPTFSEEYESLSVSHGLVVVGASDCTSASEPPGTLWAYNASTGALAWTTPMPGAGPLQAASAPGSFVLAEGGDAAGSDVAVFNLSSGKVAWSGFGCSFRSTPPLVVGNLVMSYGCDNQQNPEIQGRNLATGSVAWTQDGDWALQRGDRGSAAGTHLYATNPAGAVVDLNPQTGTVRYSLSKAVTVLAVDSSRVYATCASQGEFVCGYNIGTGALEWRNTQPSVVGTTIAAEADGVLYTPFGSALNTATGKIITQTWDVFTYSNVTAMAVGDGRIAVAGDPRVLDLFGLPGS